MNMKRLSGYSSPDQSLLLNTTGSIVGSFVVVVLVAAGCAICRRRRSKKNGHTEQGRERRSGSAQNENEYQVPVTHTNTREMHEGTSSPAGTNEYTVPNKPNIVYSDLDKQALSISGEEKPSHSPTTYAAIDQEKTAAIKQERQYANIGSITLNDGNIYENFNN